MFFGQVSGLKKDLGLEEVLELLASEIFSRFFAKQYDIYCHNKGAHYKFIPTRQTCPMSNIVDYRLPNSAAPEYTLKITNNSAGEKFFFCFQNQTSGLPNSSYPLAWFAAPAAKDTSIYFQWNETYDFVWAQTGSLQPGVIFRSGQVTPAQLNTQNQITFTRSPAGAYHFQDQTNTNADSLLIKMDGTIPLNNAAVGIGMSSRAIQAVQAQPNINAPYSPSKPPEYQVSFGLSQILEGQVLNVTDFQAIIPLRFPPNQYGAIATLQENNTWHVEYEPVVLAE